MNFKISYLNWFYTNLNIGVFTYADGITLINTNIKITVFLIVRSEVQNQEFG